ncbi:MAG TPA: hypothetical protein DHI91_00330 [Candidatus Portnoybacteria bacterium]|nr:hypothetical protein [Candidatus Portnoybacteria bacterium]
MVEKLKKEKQKQINLNWKIINRLLLVLIFFFGASYLIGVNDLSIKTIMLQQQKIKIFNLKNQISDLDLTAMSLGSYTSVSQRLPELSLVKVDQVEYVAGTAAVAINK